MNPIKLLILTGSITLSMGNLSYSKSSESYLKCDTYIYDNPRNDKHHTVPKHTKYYYYGRRYDNWHNISSFKTNGIYIAGVVTTNNLLCKWFESQTTILQLCIIKREGKESTSHQMFSLLSDYLENNASTNNKGIKND